VVNQNALRQRLLGAGIYETASSINAARLRILLHRVAQLHLVTTSTITSVGRNCFEETIGCRFAAADAVGEARACVGVAAEGEGGELLEACAEGFEAFEVAEVVLSHRARPLLDVCEEGRGRDAEQFA